jgi:hypothetical protein
MSCDIADHRVSDKGDVSDSWEECELRMVLALEICAHALVRRTSRRVGKSAMFHRSNVGARRNPELKLVDWCHASHSL